MYFAVLSNSDTRCSSDIEFLLVIDVAVRSGNLFCRPVDLAELGVSMRPWKKISICDWMAIHLSRKLGHGAECLINAK